MDRLLTFVAVFFLLAVLLPKASAQSSDALRHLWTDSVDAKALESRVEQHLSLAQSALDRLLAVKGKRTVSNTLVPFDDAIEELDAASYQSQLLQSVHPQSSVRDMAQAMVQKVSSAQTALSLNQAVYHALAALDVSRADAATCYYVNRQLLLFRLSGVDRDEPTRARIKTLSDEITKLGLSFQRNIQEDVKQIPVAKAELDGLPADFIARHKPDAEGAITLTSEPPEVFPVLKFAASAELRQRVFLAYTNRAYPRNGPVLAELLKKREELAALLGYRSWADYNAADKMAQNAASIASFIDSLDAVSFAPANREYEMLMTVARRQQPSFETISAADTAYWQEQVRRIDFAFDSQSARPYFPYARVQQGILDIASRLFHVRFVAVRDAVVWDSSVTTWDVFDGKRKLGRFYLDMHPRPGKDKWFASFPVLDGKRRDPRQTLSSHLSGTKRGQLPEAALVCNFPGGKPNDPSPQQAKYELAGDPDPGLMEYGDVVTFFHEFGHLMHWIFQGRQRWAGYANMMEADFVEAPSQMLEEWMHDPKVLATFARHYQTNEPIPEEMVRRMNRAEAFGRGLWTRRQLALTATSFRLHDEPAPDVAGLERTYSEMWRHFLPYAELPGDHMIDSFGHLVGYSSGYYTYLWDKVIAEDFFHQFDQNNLLAGDAPLRYRKTVLEATGTMPANDLVKNFLGRPQSVDALIGWINQEFQSEPSPSAGR